MDDTQLYVPSKPHTTVSNIVSYFAEIKNWMSKIICGSKWS